jgi:molecular chaperone DnaK
LLTKGTALPASGSKKLKAAFGLGPHMPGHIDLELFQDEGADDPELNLNIGVFRVSHEDLPASLSITEGDPVIFHWTMNDSGLLTGTIELPSVRQTFSTKRFYVDQAGHRSFDGDAGEKLVEQVISSAENDTAEIVAAVGPSAKVDVGAIERKLEDQRKRLRDATSSDERRSITEIVRHIRQEAARLRGKPEHRGRVLEYRLADRVKAYNDLARPAEANDEARRFDQLGEAAGSELKRMTTAAFEMAETIIEQMDAIYWRALWRKSDFVAAMFDRATRERHLAADKEAYDLLVVDGRNALANEDVDELRAILGRIYANQIVSARVSSNIANLASVLRG